jgi:hypothetical protein
MSVSLAVSDSKSFSSMFRSCENAYSHPRKSTTRVSVRPVDTFAANASILKLDAHRANGRYMKLFGPMLQPDIEEKETSLDQVEVADEFLQGLVRAASTGVYTR